jgi:hypothetical protein
VMSALRRTQRGILSCRSRGGDRRRAAELCKFWFGLVVVTQHARRALHAARSAPTTRIHAPPLRAARAAAPRERARVFSAPACRHTPPAAAPLTSCSAW